MSKIISEPNEARKRVAANLRRVRIAAGYSQERLAQIAGFHRTYVSQIERCKLNVTIDAMWKLSELLEIDPAELLKSKSDG
ncbi:helix-turn-helix domain-containing protein [Paraburkholderia fungorum]|uniref:helix-turn-helix domain-containing protein n=1 Tax=Paraburkholderia fungorum TaxID=134537 RepID=UPI002093BA67|nr:helix-turn-helix transcriptional regulator [Paraburkholderia fungorum]USU18913.1 helix-turn-helix domain-containing protein [Paraburkholderia fungorum]USU29091.1 helix-turn-helix domain-containing protein [Paraburkholderia fungorum]